MRPKSGGENPVAKDPGIKAIEDLARREKADIYLFSAFLMPTRVDRLRNLICNKKKKAQNAILFLTTFGGDGDSAYRLASCLRRHYKNGTVRAYVFGLCKSAGTLAVLGADEIVFGDFGELGPLDVQLTKPDEVYPTSSGLDIFQAVGVVTQSAFEAYQNYFDKIIENSEGHISAKTSAEIARELAVGLFAPMTGQIEPERLGEVQRAINIASVYGRKLNRGNLKKDALERLVQGYPAHGFVIDSDEARTLFIKVRNADILEHKVGNYLPGLRRQGSTISEQIVLDVVESYKTTTGSQNVAQTPAKPPRPAAATSKRRASSQAKRNAPGDAKTPPERGDARRPTAKGRAIIAAPRRANGSRPRVN
jgi:hypothetical protein